MRNPPQPHQYSLSYRIRGTQMENIQRKIPARHPQTFLTFLGQELRGRMSPQKCVRIRRYGKCILFPCLVWL